MKFQHEIWALEASHFLPIKTQVSDFHFLPHQIVIAFFFFNLYIGSVHALISQCYFVVLCHSGHNPWERHQAGLCKDKTAQVGRVRRKFWPCSSRPLWRRKLICPEVCSDVKCDPHSFALNFRSALQGCRGLPRGFTFITSPGDAVVKNELKR